MMTTPKIKRLFLDIETSLNIVASFSLWPKSISHNNILQDWHIICAAWKWEGDKEIHSAKTYNTNDKKVVRALRNAIMKADEIVYHNGKKFDYKKINTRILVHGLDPMDKPRETDTLSQARKHFSFTSNRLDYLAQVLVKDAKLVNTPGLWMAALQGDKKAIDDMDTYCKQDVVILEKVFQVMKPHIEVGFNANLLAEEDVCSSCGGANIIKHGVRRTKTHSYQRYKCHDCLSISRSGTRIPSNIKVRK